MCGSAHFSRWRHAGAALFAVAMLACAAGGARAAPDLTIAKSHTSDFVAGVNGTYRLLVQNVGTTSTLAPTTVRDTLPAGLSYVSGVGTGWIVSASGQVVTCTRVGLLAAGDTSGITLTVLPGGAAVPGVTNSAVVSVLGDSNGANNRATDPTTVRQVDMSITKSHVGNFTVGLDGSYSISVTNQGDASTFNSTSVVDTLPPGITFVSGVGSGWSVSALGQVVTANHAGLIAPGASRSFTLNIRPDTTSAPNLVNRAHVVAGGDFISGNNTASDPTVVLGAPDLRITKSHTGLFLILTNEEWTIEVENVGTGPTTGIITVRDTLPNNISYVSASGSGWSFSVSGQIVTGTRSTPIAPGETSTLTIRVNVGLLALPSVTNSASVTTSGDGNAANNRDTDLTGVVLGVDLAMRKTHDCRFTVGHNGVYTLTIVNLGSAPHIGPAVITDVLPPGLTYVSGTGFGWLVVAVGPTVTATYAGTIAPGDSAVVTITVAVGPAALPSVTNIAAVVGVGDVDVTNDLDADVTEVTPVDLALTKSHAGDFTVGTNGVYSLTLTNVGTGPTTSMVTVLDTLPAGLTFVSGVGPGWSASASGQIVTATFAGPLLAGGSSTMALTVAVTPAAAPGVTNRATLWSDEDCTPENNSDTDPTVVSAVDLAIGKRHNQDFVVGANGVYRLVVTSVGSEATLGTITVRDTLPVGLTYVSSSGAGWSVSASGQVVTATHGGPLAPGDSLVLDLTVLAGPPAVPGVTNVAHVWGTGDVNPSNDRALDPTVVIGEPDLSIVKTHGADFVVGSNGIWTLTVSNGGSAPTTGAVTVRDTLPAGVSFVSGSGPSWSVVASGQIVTATYSGAIAPGGSAVLEITVAVLPAAWPSIVNIAHVETPGDPNNSNDFDDDVVNVIGAPNAAITKTHVSGFDVGGTGAYALVVTNAGNLPTTGATTVSDTLPAGLTFVSGGGEGWSVSAVGQIVTAVYAASLAPGDTARVDVTVSIGPAAAPSVTNGAWVTTPGDTVAVDDHDTDTTPVGTYVDVMIEKTHASPFVVGSNASWTITVTNVGTVATSGITVVRDTLPVGTTYVSASGAGWSFSVSGQVVTAIHPGPIAIDASTSFDITVTVGVAALPGVTNAATVEAISDTVITNDRDVDPTPVAPAPAPDLSIAKTHPGSFTAGTNGTWTITVTNSGSAPTVGITTVRDTLPAGVTYVSASGAGWSFSVSGQVVTAIHPSAIAPGASTSFDIVVSVGAGAVPGVTNSASVETPGDSDPAGDRTSDPTVVNPAATPNLSITKTHAGSFAVGTNGTWTITVTNSGSAPTTGVTTVRDTLPVGITFVSASGVGWSFNVSGQVVTAFHGGPIAAGASASFDIVVSVGVAAMPGVTNSASVETPGDTDPSDDRTSDPTIVNPAAAPNLSIIKTHVGSFTVGTNGTWTITVTNSGSAPTAGVTTVRDTLPLGITYVSASGSGWSFIVNGQVVTAIHPSPIAPGAGSSFDIVVSAGAAALPGVTNSASVETPDDTDPSGDQTSDPTVVNPGPAPNLSITKTHIGSFTVGTNGTWTITVTNSGSAPTTGVTTVRDTLPAGITYVSASGAGWSFTASGQVVTAIHVGPIAPGASASFDITVAVGAFAAPGVTNSASVEAPGDTDPSGDQASDPTVVNPAATPNLSITKTHVGSFAVGTNGTWTITVTNSGSAPTTGVTTVRDTLPAGITYVSASGAGWSFSVSGQIVTALHVGAIAPGTGSSFDITVAVGALAVPGVTNSASVETPGDTDPSGDQTSDPTVVNPGAAPNLSIAKSHVGSFAVGTNGTWTITVTNSGSAPTTGVTTVRDTLPTGTTYVSAAGVGWSFSVSGQIITAIYVGPIAVGASTSFDITVAVGALAAPGVTNSASVETPGDSDPGGDRTIDPTVVNPGAAPNLSITKSHVGTFAVGTNGTWTITVTNSGSAPTTGVTTVRDTLPTGITYVSATGTGWSFSVSGQIVTAIHVGPIAVGASSSFDITVAVGPAALPGVTNSASVETPGDTDPSGDQASDPTTVNPGAAPNLSITKTHVGSFAVGTNGTWTITVTNSGSAPTTGVTTVRDTLPAGITYVSATGVGWSFSVSGQIVTAIHVGPIAVGASSSFDITVAVSALAAPGVTNSASVETPGDSDPGGDRTIDPTVVNPGAAPNLSITKTHAGSFAVGTNGTWTITVTNSGSAPTTGVTTVRDTLPTGTTYVSAAGVGWSFSVSGQIVTAIHVGPIAVGASSSFDITVAVGALAAPGVTNSASVETPGDTDPSGDQTSDPTVVNPGAAPNLSIAKSHVGSFAVGTNGTWTITVTNSGSAPTTGVTTVRDTLPAGITYVSATGTGWSFSVSGQIVTAIHVGPIAVGASTSFDITVAVGAQAAPGVANSASVETPGDSDPGGDRTIDPTVVNPGAAPNLSITKTHVGTFAVGTNGTWTITVANSGSAPTTGVTTVRDTLPLGVTYVSASGTGWSFSVSGQIVTAIHPGPIAVGASTSFDITVAVGALAAPGVTNSASVETPGDSDPGGDRTIDPTVVNPGAAPNLSITKSHVGTFAVGTNGTWTITVTNSGSAPTTGVTTVRDTLPNGITYVSATGTGWSFSVSGQVVTAIHPGPIAVGASTSFDITVAVGALAAPGVTNSASVETPGDSDPGGDRTIDPTIVNPGAAPNLSVTKTHVGTFAVGTNGTWTITVTNSGSAPTTGVTTVRDTLPTGTTYVSAVGTGWSFSVSGQIVTAIHPGPIAVGASTSFDITVAVGALAAPGVTNSASVETPGDSDPGGDRTIDPTIVNPGAAPNLSVTKTHVGTFAVGTNGTWTISVTNSGSASTTGVTTVRDTLPTGITYVSAAGTGWSFSVNGQIVTAIHVGPIAVGASTSFDITVAVGALAAPGVTNSASVETPGDSDPGGDRTIDPTIVNPGSAPNLSVTKTHVGTFAVGTNGTWTITVTNSGSAPTTGVTTVRDTLPTGITYVSATGTGWSFSVTGQIVTAIHPGPIAVGASTSFDITVAVGALAAPGVTNSASVETPGDSDPGGDRTEDPTTVDPAATHDVSLAMSDVGPVMSGDLATYTLTVTNTRSIPTAGMIVVADTLPAGLTFESASGAGWSFSANGSIVNAFWPTSLASGATASWDVTVRVWPSAMPSVLNAATVWLTGDGDLSNNRASDMAAVLAPPAPDLTIAKTHASDFVVGTNGTYTLTVTNLGGSTAVGPITVRDTLPAGLTFAAATGSGWSFSQNGNVVSAVNLAGLAPGTSSSFDVTVSVGFAAAPGVTNAATVIGPGDSDPTNDRALDPTIVRLPGLLTLTKRVAPEVAEPGDFVTYTLTIGNPSPITADSVELRDHLPLGVAYERGTARLGTLQANDPTGRSDQLVFGVGTVPSGGSVVLRYRARVGAGAALGDGINRARAVSVTDGVESNLASARIELREGVFDPRGIIFGKVYLDRDCDPRQLGTQGDRELGIPGVRLLLEDGSVAITDVEGKYHFDGVSPRAHVLHIDASTLPPGARLSVDGSRTMHDAGTRLVDLQRGEMHRADFLESSHADSVLDAVVARRALGEVNGALAEQLAPGADSTQPMPAPSVGAAGLVAHGLVEGRVDLHSSRRGLLARRDGFTDELRDAAVGTSDDRASAAARGALFMQGPLKGGYELTLATDSERDPREHLFRDLEPDRFHPVYGDASIREYGAPSAGNLFARIRKDSSFVQYGDFTTPADPARRLGRYDRSFTGVTQRFAGRPLALEAWGAESHTRRVVDELPGRGTSGPYALGRSDARENSEQVDVVVRDRNQPSRVLESRRLERYADYQFDPTTGEIVLRAPLASLDHDLNPQTLRVTYEVEGAGERYLVYGAGVRARARNLAEITGHAVRDEDPFEPRDLMSAGAALFAGANTTLRGEVARTDSAGVRGGDAVRAELVHRTSRLSADVSASRVARTFVNPSSALVPGRTEFSARLSAVLDSGTVVRAEGLRTQDDVTDGKRDGFDASLERRFGRLGALVGYRRAKETTAPATATSAGTTPNEFQSARGRLSLPFPGSDRATLFAEYEQDLEASDARRALAGADWMAENGTRLYARHEFLSSFAGPYALHSDRELQTTLVGVDAPVAGSGRTFGEYRARDAFSGRDAQAAIGLRNRWTVRSGLHVDGSFEQVMPVGSGGPEEATAVTGALEYTASPRWKGSARTEWRNGASGDDWLASAGVARKLSRDWTFLSRALWLDRESAQRTELRLRGGFAWRQTLSDRWHALGRYELHRLEDAATPGDPVDRVAHILAGDLNVKPGRRLTTSFHVAGRQADDRSGGLRTQSRTMWLAGRMLWDVTPRWDAGFSASSLFDRGMTAHRHGLGLELGRTLTTNLRFAGGYNLFGYRDDELTGDLSTDHGGYLTLRFKFDEDVFRGRRDRPAAPAEAKP